MKTALEVYKLSGVSKQRLHLCSKIESKLIQRQVWLYHIWIFDAIT